MQLNGRLWRTYLKPASAIVQEVYTNSKEGIYNSSRSCVLSCISLFFLLQQGLLEEVAMTAPCPALSKPEYLARTAYLFRQSKRPKDPTSIESELEDDALPENFL